MSLSVEWETLEGTSIYMSASRLLRHNYSKEQHEKEYPMFWLLSRMVSPQVASATSLLLEMREFLGYLSLQLDQVEICVEICWMPWRPLRSLLRLLREREDYTEKLVSCCKELGKVYLICSLFVLMEVWNRWRHFVSIFTCSHQQVFNPCSYFYPKSLISRDKTFTFSSTFREGFIWSKIFLLTSCLFILALGGYSGGAGSGEYYIWQ